MVAIRIFYLSVVIIILETMAYFGGQYYYSHKYHGDEKFDARNWNQTRFVTSEDAIKQILSEVKLEPKYKIVKVETQDPKKLEALINEAMAFWRNKFRAEFEDSLQQSQTNFVAEANTSFEDSTVAFKVDYVSPIPIHPDGYFVIRDVKAKEKHITITSTNEVTLPYNPSFWDRFAVFVGGGAGWDFFQKQPTVNAGVYVGFELKKIF